MKILTPWKKGVSKYLFENPWWKYRFDECTLPNGQPGTYHVVESASSVMILPREADGRWRLVRQYRYLEDRESLEFPCGNTAHAGQQDDPAVAALRELGEESGVQGDLQKIGHFAPFNGICTEMCHVYLATNLQVAPLAPDDSEEFAIELLTTEEIDDKIRSGEIWDGMSLAAWAIYRTTLI